MDPITIALLGGSLLGGIFSASGSKKATEAQVGAANDTIDFQQGIYDSQQQMFDPFYQSGVNALAAYNYEMGLGPMPGSGQNSQLQGGGGGFGQVQSPGSQGGFVGAVEPTNLATGFSPNGGQMGLGPVPGQHGSQMGGQTPSNMPQRPSYQAFNYGSSSPQYQDFDFQSSPGYQFQLQQGQRALDGTAASQGGVFSGATQKAQMDYATGLASQDYNNQFRNHLSAFGADLQGFQAGYNNAFQNHQTTYGNQSNEHANYMNQLSGLAGAGQSAAGQTASAAGNLGATVGQANSNIGNAQSAGAVAMGNTINNSLGNALSSYGYLNTVNSGMFG